MQQRPVPQLQPPPRPKPLPPPNEELEEGEDPLAAQAAADEKALATIHAIVKPRDAHRAATSDAANEVLAAAGLVLPSPHAPGPPGGGGADAAAAGVAGRGASEERGRERSRERSKDRSSRDGRHGSRGRGSRHEEEVTPEVAERKLAEAFDANRERAKKEEEVKKRADDARYERKLKELETRERSVAGLGRCVSGVVVAVTLRSKLPCDAIARQAAWCVCAVALHSLQSCVAVLARLAAARAIW